MKQRGRLVVGVGALLGLLGCAVPPMFVAWLLSDFFGMGAPHHPTDIELRATLREHRAEFDRIAAAFANESRLREVRVDDYVYEEQCGASTCTRWAGSAPTADAIHRAVGIPVARAQMYIDSLNHTGALRLRQTHSECIEFVYYSYGIITSGSDKSLLRCPNLPLGNMASDTDIARYTATGNASAISQIDEHWFIQQNWN